MKIYHSGLQDRPTHQRPTVCVTGAGAGVDSAWEQEKLEVRKMPENAAESHTSGARFVGPCMIEKTSNSVITCQTHMIDLIQLQTEQTLLCPSLQLFQRVDALLKMDLDVRPMLVE